MIGLSSPQLESFWLLELGCNSFSVCQFTNFLLSKANENVLFFCKKKSFLSTERPVEDKKYVIFIKQSILSSLSWRLLVTWVQNNSLNVQIQTDSLAHYIYNITRHRELEPPMFKRKPGYARKEEGSRLHYSLWFLTFSGEFSHLCLRIFKAWE